MFKACIDRTSKESIITNSSIFITIVNPFLVSRCLPMCIYCSFTTLKRFVSVEDLSSCHILFVCGRLVDLSLCELNPKPSLDIYI